MLGWSRGKVSNYVALKEIDKTAWEIIATTLENNELPRQESDVAQIATSVAFNETLLRQILNLTPAQQLQLVTDFSKGENHIRDTKGYLSLEYKTFEEMGETEFGYEKVYIHRLANAAIIEKSLELPIGNLIPESQLRPLSSIPEEERKAIWDEANRYIESYQPRARRYHYLDSKHATSRVINPARVDNTSSTSANLPSLSSIPRARR